MNKLDKIDEYLAVEIKEDGIWRRPACWLVNEKYIANRVKQLRGEGFEVRVKRITEYRREEILSDKLPKLISGKRQRDETGDGKSYLSYLINKEKGGLK